MFKAMRRDFARKDIKLTIEYDIEDSLWTIAYGKDKKFSKSLTKSLNKPFFI